MFPEALSAWLSPCGGFACRFHVQLGPKLRACLQHHQCPGLTGCGLSREPQAWWAVAHSSHTHKLVVLDSMSLCLLDDQNPQLKPSPKLKQHLSHQHHVIVLALAVLYEALAPVQVPDHRALELCGRPHLPVPVTRGQFLLVKVLDDGAGNAHSFSVIAASQLISHLMKHNYEMMWVVVFWVLRCIAPTHVHGWGLSTVGDVGGCRMWSWPEFPGCRRSAGQHQLWREQPDSPHCSHSFRHSSIRDQPAPLFGKPPSLPLVGRHLH